MDYNITYRTKDKGIQFIISYKDYSGKWKQKSKQGFKSSKEAKRAADKMLDELKETFKVNLNTEYDGITLREYTKVYMNDKQLVIEQNTINAYLNALKWLDKLMDKPVEQIQHMHIQDCINDMIKVALKRSTIKSYITKYKNIFDKAVDHYKVIKANPIGRIDLPEEKTNTKIKALTKNELDDLLNRIESQKDYVISLIASTCGLRIGEILGLTWSDIDNKKNTLTVSKQQKKMKNGKYGIGTVKEKRSNRIIPVSKSTIDKLNWYKDNNPTDTKNKVILEYNNDTTSSRLFCKYKRLGYDISVHDLRHTYATMLLADGLDYQTVADLLGDTVQVVMKNYSHVNKDMMVIAKNKINAIF